MTDRNDGRWDAPTEHDDHHEVDGAELSGDDPPTIRASEAQRARARSAAVADQLATAHAPTAPPPLVNANVVAKPPGSTLPPPIAQRQPAKGPASVAPPSPPRAAPAATPPRPTPAAKDEVVVLDRVSANTPAAPAPRRSESAAGGIVVVATGSDGERVRKLCHKHGLLVPVMTSLAVVHDAMSIVVVGEPSPPAAERVVHVVRPALPDEQLIELLRALVSGRTTTEPPQAGAASAHVADAARTLAKVTDRGAIEAKTIEAVTALTGADRAHCLFHDPATGALWSEAKRRAGGDDRHAMAGLVGWAAHTGQAVFASPAGDDPRWLQELDDPGGKPQSRVLVQPIVGADRRVHAVLVAVRRWRNTDFTDAERAALASFAALAGPTLDLAVAASPAEARKPRATMPGVAKSASALAAPRPAGDSRPPPVTAPRADAPPARKPGGGTAPAPFATKQPAAHIVPLVDDATRLDDATRVDDAPRVGSGPIAGAKPDDRYSSDSILSLPTPPSVGMPSASLSWPAMPVVDDKPPPPSPPPVADKRPTPPAPRPQRPHTASELQRLEHRTGEPRDLAVIANDDDARRVRRIATKLRLELSTFARISEVPAFYTVVTLGEAWGGDDPRIAYAARAQIADDQLGDLLTSLAHGRAVAPAAPVTKPASAAEARRSQLAFAGARKLAATTDLAAAEAIAVQTIADLLDTDRAYCCFVDPTTGALWSEVRRRAGGDDRRAIAGIAGWVARTGRAANVPRASADPRWLGPLDDPEGDPHSQLLVQPLIRLDERVHGIVIAARRARRPGFTETDAGLLARFAALATPLFEQIAVAAETQQMLGDDTSSRAPQPTAPESPLQAIVRGTHPQARWIYAGVGAVVGLLLGLLL